MFVKQRLVWALALVLAALTTACSGLESAASLTAPSAIERSTTSALTDTQAAALAESCRVGSGDVVIAPGTPPSSPPPPGTPPQAGSRPGEAPGPAAPGTQVAVGGTVEDRAGNCPEITLRIGGRNVRIGAATSFGSGSCSSLEKGQLVGAMGTAQADGSIVASCVAVGL
jgi:hypothetical protein